MLQELFKAKVYPWNCDWRGLVDADVVWRGRSCSPSVLSSNPAQPPSSLPDSFLQISLKQQLIPVAASPDDEIDVEQFEEDDRIQRILQPPRPGMVASWLPVCAVDSSTFPSFFLTSVTLEL